MNQSDIFKAIVLEPYRVLGVKLLPFSLGHFVLLHRFGSVFAGGEANPNPFTDLALAVLICSRTYEQAVADLSDPTLPKALRKWHKKIAGKGLFRRAKPIDLNAKWFLFLRYLAEGEWTPVFQTDPNRTRRVGLPFVQAVRVKIQSAFHMSDTEVFNRPWSLCKLDYYTLCDAENIITIWDDAAQSELQRLRDKAAEVAQRLASGEMKVNW